MKLKAILAAAACVTAFPAAAQSWPSKPIRLLTPYPGGSGTDIFLRALAQEFTNAWGQSVLVENRPGASTLIAADTCAKAASDGTTLCMLDRALSALPYLHRKLPYDPDQAFTPIMLMANVFTALAVSRSVPANSFAELIQYAKANPGKLNYSSPGEGTTSHLLMEWMKRKHGVDIVHVPFKSPPEIVQTLMAGEIQVTNFGLINLLGPIRSGKVRALAVSGNARSPLLPDVPTLKEAGLGELDDRVWFGLFGPVGLPDRIVDKASREVARIFAQPDFRKTRLIDQGWEPIGMEAEAFARFMKADRAVVGEMVRISGARLQD